MADDLDLCAGLEKGRARGSSRILCPERKAGPSQRQVQNERHARFQTFRERCKHDFRDRVDASHSQRTIWPCPFATRRYDCSRRLECRPHHSIRYPIYRHKIVPINYLHQNPGYQVLWRCPSVIRQSASAHQESKQIQPTAQASRWLSFRLSARRRQASNSWPG